MKVLQQKAKVQALKIFLIPIISPIMSVFYYTPWLTNTPHDVLGLYVMAFFWFLLVWIVAIYYVIKADKLRSKTPELTNKYMYGLGLIIFSYIIVLIGFFSGYTVTV